MTWAMYHTQSEKYSGLAEVSVRNREYSRAIEYYRLAAEEETKALNKLDPKKQRTYGVTVVSAVSLWYKAHEYQKALTIAYKGLANEILAPFAADELQELIQYIWSEESRQKAGIDFSEAEVLISVSGGEIVKGGAPLELILSKVDEVSKIFYRTIELVLFRPFRKHGPPSQQIQEQFKPWLFQAPAGSYQFAIKIQRPKQLSLFPEDTPEVEQITQKFLQIVKASIDDPKELQVLVPDKQYRDTFLKLTRNLAPTGKSFNKLEITSPSEFVSPSIVLLPTSRETINQEIRLSKNAGLEEVEEIIIQLKGVLRGLQLDNDWLEIDEDNQEYKQIRVINTGEAIDDVVGPMVNRRVIVDVVQKPNGQYAFRDIQLDE